ncbi:intracellular signal transduction [Mactra antiquata]
MPLVSLCKFLCQDESEAPNSISPRRTIETSKEVTPGGTLVTTETTTTQRPQNSRFDTSIDGSPSYIEKKSFDYNTSTSSEAPISAFYSPITTESTPIDEHEDSRMSVPPSISSPESPEINHPPQAKERKSFAARIKKRFSRSKKRSHSADRATSSLREGSNYLQPPGPHSKDDIDLHKVKRNEETPNLKKSRSLGGSLKKLFRRSRKRSRSRGRGEQSRESSMSRQSRHTSLGPSREGSLTRSSYNPSQQDTVIL